MKKYRGILLFLLAFMTISCGKEKKKPVFYDSGANSETNSFETTDRISAYNPQTNNSNIISIPFTEKGGVKYVNVSVNGFGFEMIFDTGCSSTLISSAEANYLYQKGYLTKNDILGITQSQIADGSIVENMVINLKEVIIDGKIPCFNVIATVSANNNAPMLLGNEVLDRVASYEIDNQNKTINFTLK